MARPSLSPAQTGIFVFVYKCEHPHLYTVLSGLGELPHRVPKESAIFFLKQKRGNVQLSLSSKVGGGERELNVIRTQR